MRRTIVIAIAALMAVAPFLPGVAAYQSSIYDQHEEPNNELDRTTVPTGALDTTAGDATFMWQDAATLANLDTNGNGEVDSDEERIYFDIFIDNNWLPWVPRANPQGPTGGDSSVGPYGEAVSRAVLGYWRDCNNDGFIGDATTGEREYLVLDLNGDGDDDDVGESNVDEALCPPTTNQLDRDWMYNDGTTVYELISIGPGARDIAVTDLPGSGTGSTLNEEHLCPDRTTGPTGSDQPGRGTPRADSSSTDNLLCYGGNPHYIQDDYAKMWGDWGLATDTPALTSPLLPLPDGTFRDSNGLLRFVGTLSGLDNPGLLGGAWPSQEEIDDPQPGNQCHSQDDPVADGDGDLLPDGGDSAVDFVSDDDNDGTINGINDADGNGIPDRGPKPSEQDGDGRYAEDDSSEKTANSYFNCSPVPNYRYVSVPLLATVEGGDSDDTGNVAFPGHLAEDRINNSENNQDGGQPIAEPFYRPDETDSDDGQTKGECELRSDPDEWDQDYDSGGADQGRDTSRSHNADGDPIAGYDSANDPTDFSDYYSEEDTGPSVDPTIGHAHGAIAWKVESQTNANAKCNDGERPFGDRVQPFGGSNWLETHAGQGSQSGAALKNDADFPYGYTQPEYFNPSDAPGVGPDTYTCARTDAPVVDIIPTAAGFIRPPAQCGGNWASGVILILAGLATPNIWTQSAYADVSFGEKGNDCKASGVEDSAPGQCFDPKGDLAFSASVADDDRFRGVYDANPMSIQPATQLPGGDNAHQYGDEQCTSITALNTGTDTIVPSEEMIRTNGFETVMDGSTDTGILVPRASWDCDRNNWATALSLKCGADAGQEISCYLNALVGDPYDLRDTECYDWDLFGIGTIENIDATSVGPVGVGDRADCDTALSQKNQGFNPDQDGDGVQNGPDAFPNDPSETRDTDSDGVGDNADNCPWTFNPDQTDADNDGAGDVCDSDPTDPGQQ